MAPPGPTPALSRLSFLVCLSLSLLFIVLLAFSAPQSPGLPPVGSLQGRNWLTRGKHVDWKGEGDKSHVPRREATSRPGLPERMKFLNVSILVCHPHWKPQTDSTPAPRSGLKKEGRGMATILHTGSGASVRSLHPGSGPFVPTGR